MLYVIVRYVIMVLFKVLFRLQVFGLGSIPLKGGFILASNHVSYLDPPALAAACPRALSFLAKEELFTNNLFGHFFRNVNVFPIPLKTQFKTQPGVLKALRWAIRRLNAGKALVIFPEGRRTSDGELEEPMRGIGLLTTKTAVPIIPAFIEGSSRALPVHAKFIRLKKIKVYFGRAIWPQKLGTPLNKREFYRVIAEGTMEEIRR
ncbi:unnamed protein product, partial [marine sediment metagenome]